MAQVASEWVPLEEHDAWLPVEAAAKISPSLASPVKPPAESPQETALRQSMVGASPTETIERLKGAARSAGRVGMGALQYLQYLSGHKVSPTPLALEPSVDPNQHVGEMVGNAALAAAPSIATAGAALPVQAAVGSAVGGMEGGVPGAIVGGILPVATKGVQELIRNIPSAASAGKKFQQIMGKAKDVPLNTSAAEDAVARAQELRQRGSSMPKVLNDFAKNRKNSTGDFMGVPVADPMTYEVGRDFASNAGNLSARETMAQNPQMKRQVAQFAGAMKDANRKAAEQVGMGDLYDEAMKEYHQAKTIQEAAEAIKKWGARAGLLAIGGEAVYRLAKIGGF